MGESAGPSDVQKYLGSVKGKAFVLKRQEELWNIR